MRKCNSVSRSSIDESDESVSRSRIVFRHEIVVKLTCGESYFCGVALLNRFQPVPLALWGQSSNQWGTGKLPSGRAKLIMKLCRILLFSDLTNRDVILGGRVKSDIFWPSPDFPTNNSYNRKKVLKSDIL